MKATQIKTELHVPIIDLKTGQYKEYKGEKQALVFRNCLLSCNYFGFDWNENEQFVLLDGSSFKVNGTWDLTGLCQALESSKENTGWSYDFAGGSRKHGLFFASKSGNIISQYFPESKAGTRITTHGSIFTSNCYSGLYEVEGLRIVILNDENKFVQNLYGLGDGYGLISKNAASKLGDQWLGQTQFRLGLKAIANQQGWTAKGTVQCVHKLVYGENEEEVDIILPFSTFKGNMPNPSQVLTINHCYLGGMLTNKPRKSVVPSAVISFFTTKQSLKYFVEHTRHQCEELNSLRQDLKGLATRYIELCKLTQVEDGEWLKEEGFDEEGNMTYQNVSENKDALYMASIISESKYPEQIFDHSVTVRWATECLAKMYRTVATTAGLKASWLIAAPEHSLPEHLVVTDAVPTGKYLIWRTPIESQASIDWVDVVGTREYYSRIPRTSINAPMLWGKSNSVFINPNYFTKFGGD